MRARFSTYGTAVSTGRFSPRAIIRHCLTDSAFLFAPALHLALSLTSPGIQDASNCLEAVQASSKG